MRKLNRKGFTLVELLAVIIILAIVVGITIPAVLTTTNSAKTKAFQTAAQTAADWIERQYQVAVTGLSQSGAGGLATLDSNFSSVCGADGSTCHVAEGSVWKIVTASANPSFVTAAGLQTKNITRMAIAINSATGRACVYLQSTANGDYAISGASKTTNTTACGRTLKLS